MDTDYQNWLWGRWAEKCMENLVKNGFDAIFADSAGDAKRIVLDRFSHFSTYGVGGSDTIRKIGIPDELRKAGKTVYDHWQEGLSSEQELEIRLNQGRCDCFFCSANGISLTGEIVNIDGMGNRNNAMTFGPKKVVIVAGMNKVAENLDAAIKRVHDIAAPMRAKSLGMNTPCAETGICSDCHSPQRICRITTILHRRPVITDISVLLVNEKLGF
ncbi:MAG: lactate utilization protein [Desulfobacterales bacterium]